MRVIAWFSCGAASAVAAKLAVEKYGDACEVVYCDTMAAEHPDNARFMADVARWIGREIRVIRSEKYATIDDVFTARRYLAGIAGAPCTVEMKKVPRFAYQQPEDVHVFGFTSDEADRIADFEANNPELSLDWILRDQGISKKQCYRILEDTGIALPVMYGLGFQNNNCIGCVKASSPAYWVRIRRHFPEVFLRRAMQSREYGARLVRIDGERRFLDELPPDAALPLFDEPEEDVSCGPQCAPVEMGGGAGDGEIAREGRRDAMEFEMLTPCTECGEIFELLDGRRNPRGGSVVICSDCADKADEEIERAEEIEELREEIENAEYDIEIAQHTIKGAKDRLRELGVDPEKKVER